MQTAMEVFQQGAEQYLVEIFRDTNTITVHGKREEITVPGTLYVCFSIAIAMYFLFFRYRHEGCNESYWSPRRAQAICVA